MSRPTDEKIQEVRDRALEVFHDPTNRGSWGMSYEEGVQAALDWVLGDSDDPISD